MRQKVKVKEPRNGPERAQRSSRGYSSNSFKTSALDGVGWSASRLCRLYPRERPGIHCTGGWVGPRAGLDRWGKSRPHRDSIPGPFSS